MVRLQRTAHEHRIFVRFAVVAATPAVDGKSRALVKSDSGGVSGANLKLYANSATLPRPFLHGGEQGSSQPSSANCGIYDNGLQFAHFSNDLRGGKSQDSAAIFSDEYQFARALG